MLNSSQYDAITGLNTPTNFGRPNWDMVFRGIKKLHSPGEAGVFFCGPKGKLLPSSASALLINFPGLGSQLHLKCNMYSEPGRTTGFRFVYGKENF